MHVVSRIATSGVHQHKCEGEGPAQIPPAAQVALYESIPLNEAKLTVQDKFGSTTHDAEKGYTWAQ